MKKYKEACKVSGSPAMPLGFIDKRIRIIIDEKEGQALKNLKHLL
jgi:hypothetical protein